MPDEPNVMDILQGVMASAQTAAIGSAVRDQIYAADAFVRMAAELQRIVATSPGKANVPRPSVADLVSRGRVAQAFEDAIGLAAFTLRKIAASTLKEENNG
jgi:hypothetical protein